MATRRIRLDVNKDGSFEAQEASRAGTNLQDSYRSAGLQILPEVLYARNVIAMPYGVKSLCEQKEFVDEFNWVPNVVSSYDDQNVIGKPFRLGSFLGSDGIYRYLLQEIAASPGQKSVGYFHHIGVDNPDTAQKAEIGLFKFYERTFPELDSDSDMQYAIFQNRTLFFKDELTTLIWPTTATFSGDVSHAVLGQAAFFEISGKNPDVTFHKIQGIDLRNTLEGRYVTGFCVFKNYTIMWDGKRIYWSNPLSIGDFTPSPGAGGSAGITEAKGDIISVVPAANGIHIFCKGNVVFGADSGDSNAPFIFREVVSSGGLIVRGGAKLVSYDTDAGFCIAMTTSGLQQIQDSQATLLPDIINRFFSGTFVDAKMDGTCEIVKRDLGSSAGIQRSLVKGLMAAQRHLFIYAALPVPSQENIENSRLFLYNLETQSISVIEGDIPAITQRVDLGRFTNTSAAQIGSKPGLLTGQFTLLRRIVAALPEGIQDQEYRICMRVIDLVNADLPTRPLRNSDVQFQFKPSLILVGDISISSSRTTVITSIKLFGKTEKPNGTNQTKVRVYSKTIMGPTSPVEFVYDEVTDRYYGIVEGPDLQIEVEGYYFYIQSMEVEVAVGGLR